MELNDNDKQRIEQAAKLSWKNTITAFEDSDEISFWEGYLTGAEYATLYERQQQIKTLNRPGSKYYVSYDPDYKDKVFGVFNKEDLTQQGAQKMAQQLNNLEAERSEVVSLLKEYANDTGAVDTNLKARVKMYLTEHKL